MSAVELAAKRCPSCGETKPLSAFSRNRSNRDGLATNCKVCHRAQVRASQAKRRTEMGEEAWKEYVRENTKKSRERTRNRRGQVYNRARARAISELIEAHRSEFDRRLAAALYEEEAVAGTSSSAADGASGSSAAGGTP